MGTLKPKVIQLKDGTEVLLRSALPEDAHDVLRTMKEIISTSEHVLIEPDELTESVEDEAETILSHLEHEGKIWISPIVNGVSVGALNFKVGNRRRSSHTGEFGISLTTPYRGKGLGRQMLLAFLDWASDHPTIETIRLKVHARNIGAIKLYQSLGFIEEGREIRSVKFSNGTYDDALCMAKHL